MSFCLGIENHPQRANTSRRKQLKRASSAKRCHTTHSHRLSTISSSRKKKPRKRPRTTMKRSDTLHIVATARKHSPIRYGACLPLYEQLSSRERGRKIFPHFFTKHAQFVNRPLERLDLLSTATQHSGHCVGGNVFVAKLLRQYLFDKSSFRSVADFAVLKLNELEAISKGTRIPNRIRTAMCCDLLESVIAAEHTLSKNVLLERLKIELYRSIYGDNDFLLNESTIIKNAYGRGLWGPPRHCIADTALWFELEPFFSRLDRVSKDAQQSAHFDAQSAHIKNERQTQNLSRQGSRSGVADRLGSDLARILLQRRSFLGSIIIGADSARDSDAYSFTIGAAPSFSAK